MPHDIERGFCWNQNADELFASPADVLVGFVDCFVAAGWTVVERSDGTAVQVGGANTAAEWNITGAWTRIADPAGSGTGREVVIEKFAGANFDMWMGMITEQFSGGAVGTRPTTTNEAQVGAPNSAINGVTNRYRFIVATAPQGSTGDVYGFAFFRCSTTGGLSSCVVEPVMSPADGTYGIPNPEPWVSFNSTALNTGNWRAWYSAGLVGQAWVLLSAETFTETSVSDPHAAAYVANVPQWRGTGATAFHTGPAVNLIERPLTGHSYPDTYNLSTDARILIGSTLAHIWPNGRAVIA